MQRLLVVLAVAVATVGCVSVDTSSDADDVVAEAEEVFQAIVDGRFEDARERFDEDVASALGAEQVEAGWNEYQERFGAYQPGRITGQSYDRSPLTVVDLALTMADGPGKFRVTFDGDDRVAGLFFLDPDQPTG